MDSYHLNYNMKMSDNPNFRLNVIAKDDNTLRISIVINSKTTIAKLKRTIELEYHELYSVNMLISIIEDAEGFVLSNNSVVGDHLKHGDTVYVQSHKQKIGTNMNLPSHLPDLFLTLRYVSGSVIKRLLQVQTILNPLDVIPEIIHLGFWYSNFQTVGNLCKLLNKIFTPENVENYLREVHEMQNTLLLKVLFFWFSQVKQSYNAFPEVFEELLTVLYKLSLSKGYCEMLSGHKILKSVLEISKDQLLKPEMKRMAVQIVRNVTGKGNMNARVQSSYIPTALGESTYQFNNLEEILQNLTVGTKESKNEALQQLAEQPKLISQATVRFDYYCKLTNIFQMRSIKDKTTSRVFSQVVKNIAGHTTREKAAEIMQKDIIRKIHNFLLDSHTEAHEAVFDYYQLVMKQSVVKGMFNVEQASELLSSPYPRFQKVSAEGLSEMSEKKISPIRFLPSIKDYLRMALKTEDQLVSIFLMKTIANLTLDEQCRYQIVNLKGIEVFIKFLEISQKNGNSELQRVCAKGLLNLSIGSRETKAKVLGHLSGILEKYYKGNFDAIAGSYIENILKAPKV